MCSSTECIFLLTVVSAVSCLSLDKAETMANSKANGTEIRCHCNFPDCIITSYMCKSTAGCFLQYLPDLGRTSIGCLHLLPREKQGQCNSPAGNALFRCCDLDMCNHPEHPEIKSSFKETLNPALMTDNLHYDRPGYSDQEVWFKAATIAVPICGSLILVMLIILAVKILRSDSIHAYDETGYVSKQRRHQGFALINKLSLSGSRESHNYEKALSYIFHPDNGQVCSMVEKCGHYHEAIDELSRISDDCESRSEPPYRILRS